MNIYDYCVVRLIEISNIKQLWRHVVDSLYNYFRFCKELKSFDINRIQVFSLANVANVQWLYPPAPQK